MKDIKESLTMIGRLIVAFQTLDFNLNMILSYLLKDTLDVTIAIATSLSFSKKLDVLKSIAPYRIHNQRILKQLDIMITLCGVAERERNMIVHSNWFINFGPEQQFVRYKPQTSRKRGLKHSTTPGTPEFIQESIDIVSRALEKVHLFGSLLERKKIAKVRFFTLGKSTKTNDFCGPQTHTTKPLK
jgi:hypothetical protein